MKTFDAVSIEHTLARFFGYELGDRDTFFDADVFRSGDPKDMAEILNRVADVLEQRILFVQFASEANGSSKQQVLSCIYHLRDMAQFLSKKRAVERENYHWEIFGALMAGITGLLETLEAQITVQ